MSVEICVKNLVKYITKVMGIGLTIDGDDRVYKIDVPYHTKRARKGAVMIRIGDGKDLLDLPKNKLKALVQGIIWRDEHFSGKSFRNIAKLENVDESYIRKIVNQTFF